MEKFKNIRGIAAPFNFINVDTDKIIPKQFLKTIKRTGLGKHLFDEMRFNDDGSEKEEFVLNKEPYRNSNILVAGDNFGCGSSREHAPWALSDFGIKCIISTSFADIFYNNSFKNGVLPIKLEKKEIDFLFDQTQQKVLELSINLQKKEINYGKKTISFHVDKHLIDRIIYGLDDVDITLKEKDKIFDFERTRIEERPWIFK